MISFSPEGEETEAQKGWKTHPNIRTDSHSGAGGRGEVGRARGGREAKTPLTHTFPEGAVSTSHLGPGRGCLEDAAGLPDPRARRPRAQHPRRHRLAGPTAVASVAAERPLYFAAVCTGLSICGPGILGGGGRAGGVLRTKAPQILRGLPLTMPAHCPRENYRGEGA